MLPITMYARTKWLTKLAVFTYPHGEQSIEKVRNALEMAGIVTIFSTILLAKELRRDNEIS